MNVTSNDRNMSATLMRIESAGECSRKWREKSKTKECVPERGEKKAKPRSVFQKGETEKQNQGVCSRKGRQKSKT